MFVVTQPVTLTREELFCCLAFPADTHFPPLERRPMFSIGGDQALCSFCYGFSFAPAVVVKYHRLGGLDHRNVVLVLEAGSQKGRSLPAF